jgi:hypothetical protein
LSYKYIKRKAENGIKNIETYAAQIEKDEMYMKIKPTHGKTPARFPANPEYKPLKTIFTPPRAT